MGVGTKLLASGQNTILTSCPSPAAVPHPNHTTLSTFTNHTPPPLPALDKPQITAYQTKVGTRHDLKSNSISVIFTTRLPVQGLMGTHSSKLSTPPPPPILLSLELAKNWGSHYMIPKIEKPYPYLRSLKFKMKGKLFVWVGRKQSSSILYN